MMRDGALLAGTTGFSLLLHGGLAVLVVTTFAARPPEPTSAQQAALSLATMSVKESTAREQVPASDDMAAGQLDNQSLASRRIPQSAAQADRPKTQPTQLLTPNSSSPETFQATSPLFASERQEALLIEQEPTVTHSNYGIIPQISDVQPAPLNTEPATQNPSPKAQITALIPTVAPSVALSQPAPETAAVVPAAAVLLSDQEAPTAKAPASQPRTTPIGTSPVTPPALSDTPAIPTDARSRTPDATPAPAEPLSSTPATTVLAWSGNLSLDVPESTVDTAAALSVSDASATGLRDALSARLADIDCARVQTVYDPETGAIDLRGHVKGDADRARLMDQLSSELGGALPLNDRLRNLEAPQCTVLIHLAEMPLPQSVDQLTNPLIIGDDLQTRTYSYTDGQTMTFDLAGADYDGWLYLDYYDSEGQVLHLLPNEFIDPLLLSAEAPLVFGDGSARDPAQGKFSMRVSAPFGEDIAVAMVANEPLFDAPRPTVEPAGPYLEALAARVEELRMRPDFKGEWVYLFIETRP